MGQTFQASRRRFDLMAVVGKAPSEKVGEFLVRIRH
jgi:hypothetical protein